MPSDASTRKKSVIQLIAAVAVLALAGVLLSRGSGSSGAATPYAYYYDLAGGGLVVDRKAGLPPFDLPREGLVRASVFSCSDCSDGASRFIGWLESYSPEALEKLRAASGKTLDEAAVSQLQFETDMQRMLAQVPTEGREIQWVSLTSLEAANVQANALGSCAGGEGTQAASCVPGPDETP